ncbi:MAG: 30S ribosomal protein S16 [Paludibacteraceae bacterium]
MATKIRLQRHGHKGYAYYHIVVADSRAPRDGRIIERIGSYNPNTNPATVELNFERALYWVNVGAQPTDTARNLLSGEGVLLMKHLQGGVKKGAFDEATAQQKFEAWKNERAQATNSIKAADASKKAEAAKQRLEVEREINKAKAAELAKKKAEALEAEAAAAAAELAAETPAAGEAPAAE